MHSPSPHAGRLDDAGMSLPQAAEVELIFSLECSFSLDLHWIFFAKIGHLLCHVW